MARHEVFDGPISESIPSSVVSFSHRRNRKDSVVSFTYFRDEEDFVEWPDEDAVDAESEADNLVVGDDQWNQFSVCQVRGQAYGRPLSSVFADPDNHSFDEENDPTISFLRYIDFRYLRFFYHPLEDKFCLISGWRDPLWTNAKVMRSGLDADDRDSREQIFGKNLVDIQQKPLLQLLMDEGGRFPLETLSRVMYSNSPIHRLAKSLATVSYCESVPVSKTPLTDDALKYLNLNAPSVHPNIAKHFLFGGTKVIRARRPHNVDDDDAIALAIVVRTGFLTTKGALVRSMLFPKPSGFKFYRDSFRYISVMAMVAILGFVASFFNFIRLGLSWHLIIVRALDLITIVVPPALPATLTIGTNFALSRLKNQNIFCISPQKVNVGGKLDVICFDKTGTLTEDGLDVLGVRTVNREMRLSDLLSDVTLGSPSASTFDASYDRKKRDVLAYIMATCHSLRIVDGELLGDPLDVKMFQFTGWSYQEGGSHGPEQPDPKFETIMPPIAKPPAPSENLRQSNFTAPLELGILRNFEFVSELRRASVIVRQFGDNGASIFVKGAPESVRAICLPDSLPQDFEDILSQYTHKGYRVIACAARYEQKLSWMKVQKMTRGDAESDLEFVGFIIFENKLKQATTETITELNQAGIRNVMCTGDNILTAVSVARECGMVSKSEQCFIPHIVEDRSHGLASSLCWENVDNPALKLDPSTLMMLVRTKVFARMSPDEKHELVEKLQSLDYCCGFCGDGANDCGALKAADVGISLSDAEASVAAPFTSRQFDVSCVPTLIRFKPPEIDLDNSNIENSENTALFLVSCFQYTLASVVLSVGPPFRKPMRSNS
ncbi:hypothetical protein APSETT445_007810 [Aspergillus pseudonomiae]